MECKCILKSKFTVCSCLFSGVEEITLTKFMIGIQQKFETLSMITRESRRETDLQERQMPMDDEKPKTILDLLDEYKG